MKHHPRPEHFGHLLLALVADTEEKAPELSRQFMWTENHRPTMGTGTFGRKMSDNELRAVTKRLSDRTLPRRSGADTARLCRGAT